MNEHTNYWNGNGKYQTLADQLLELVPANGQVDKPKQNPALEKFRLYTNAYYDLFNNGGWNRARDIYRWFPGAMSLAKKNRWDDIYGITEPRIDKIILAAAREQGLIKEEDAA